MIMSHKKRTTAFIVIKTCALFMLAHVAVSPHAFGQGITELQTLDVFSSPIKSLREDIRRSVFIIKSNKNPDLLPELKFYSYKIRNSDTFWKILASTSQNLDTLMTVNSYTTPLDASPGKTIYIPNMRGIIYENEDNLPLSKIAKRFGIHEHYISRVNRRGGDNGKYFFIPSGEVSTIERSLFLGTGFINPVVHGRRTSGFGLRKDPFNETMTFHGGIDIACPRGTKIFAARSGKVVFAGYEGGYGQLVKIQHSHNYNTYYGHLSRIYVKNGDSVNRGALIGLSGNTGRSTGPHLHFEVRKNKRPVNPYILNTR